jgi:hypothetical protein
MPRLATGPLLARDQMSLRRQPNRLISGPDKRRLQQRRAVGQPAGDIRNNKAAPLRRHYSGGCNPGELIQSSRWAAVSARLALLSIASLSTPGALVLTGPNRRVCIYRFQYAYGRCFVPDKRLAPLREAKRNGPVAIQRHRSRSPSVRSCWGPDAEGTQKMQGLRIINMAPHQR